MILINSTGQWQKHLEISSSHGRHSIIRLYFLHILIVYAQSPGFLLVMFLLLDFSSREEEETWWITKLLLFVPNILVWPLFCVRWGFGIVWDCSLTCNNILHLPTHYRLPGDCFHLCNHECWCDPLCGPLLLRRLHRIMHLWLPPAGPRGSWLALGWLQWQCRLWQGLWTRVCWLKWERAGPAFSDEFTQQWGRTSGRTWAKCI